jgi:moderate conductance mechanosensitive channel
LSLVSSLIAATVTSTPNPAPSAGSSPAPSIPGLDNFREVFAQTPDCTRDDLDVCGITLRVTGDERVAQIAGVVLGRPLRILILVVVALIIRRILHRLIERLADRIGTQRNGDGPEEPHERPVTAAILGASALLSSRRELRARTLASLLKNVTTVVITLVLALMILGELNYDLAPLLASAGVAGVALGIGCQSLVRDFVSGMFIIFEDQYGVGDSVSIGDASGTVEAVNLRVTRIRDVKGTVWYIRNGEILKVGNQSQGWSRTVLDIAVGNEEDIARTREQLLRIGTNLRDDPAFTHVIVGDPEVWGVEVLAADEFVLRLVVKTQPMQQWSVARELRRRIKEEFQRAGITNVGEYVKPQS